MNPSAKYEFDPRTQDILEHLTIPFAVYQFIDRRVVTIAVSQGFCDEFGFTTFEDAYYIMDNDMYRTTHPDDRNRVAEAAYRFAAYDAPFDVVYRTRTAKDPDYIILHAYGKSFYPVPGVRLCIVWYAYEGHLSEDQGGHENILRETLDRFFTEDKLYRGDHYDYMTGLPNMSYFYELAEAGRSRLHDQGLDSAVLYFDLTGLRQFNRRHGFAEGNRLIRSVAGILAKHFGNESCAHFAADHFAAFAPEEGLLERLSEVISEFALANDGRTLPVRVGIYSDRMELVEVGTACDRAKLAADTRKKNTVSGFAFFDMKMMEDEKNRQEIVDTLDRAIEEGWIRVYYQPIVRSTSGKVCNMEALARWQDPVRGLLMPGSFIPVLEESRLIHKLDLCVVRQVLRDIKSSEASGCQCVPVSINFSRADFDAYDLVQEISTLVDQAGVDRNMINIEITESLVGSDFDYMKEQIERFRAQGFQVWMDDFGSGYSSLDVLQSIKFDLIKFDMGFMRRLDEGDSGKIILTEMMKMATSLGVDTICEGVETERQTRFLQEIGCSKLQGYYFMKPVPREQLREKYTVEIQDGFEDPREASYYDNMGRVNLYDLSFLVNTDESVTKNTFDTIPMAIMELAENGSARYTRSNESFRDFMKRYFLFDLSKPNAEFYPIPTGPGSGFMTTLKQCRYTGGRAFFDEKVHDGSMVRSFIRWIGQNPVNRRESVAVAILSVTAPDNSTTFADIARSLAADYYNIFVVDLDTDDYVEYSSNIGGEELSIERLGEDFFGAVRRDARTRIYSEDQEAFLALFTKENVLDTLESQGVFTTAYRLTDFDPPKYVNMKITKMLSGNRIIMGISIIDREMKRRAYYEELRKERALLVRIMALSDGYLSLFTVDPKTGHYVEYSSSEDFDSLGAPKGGDDFYKQAYLDAMAYLYEPDIRRFQEEFTLEKTLAAIRDHGSFSINYRLVIKGEPRPVNLKAALFNDGVEDKLVIGIRAWKKRQQ
ncbi:MAG: EAL domain-containing protein [Lachnospiraceae bacterium]|nr:EAL domain-containing protein [Lachnospiraceae bacterium]